MTDRAEKPVCPAVDLVADDLDAENARREWISVDLDAFNEMMRRNASELGSGFDPAVKHRNIVSRTPVILSERDLNGMADAIDALYEVFGSTQYREYVLQGVSEISHYHSNASGVMMGFDFHITPEGPKLIEVNTNAGGALINAGLLLSQASCCAVIEKTIKNAKISDTVADRIFASFLAEWQASGHTGRPEFIAIVDENPAEQYLYPELLQFRSLFRSHGIRAEIVAPEDLRFSDGRLFSHDQTVDLVYNRVTDFYFENPANSALREAWLSGGALITPNPVHHAVMARKNNLAILSDPELLRSLNIPEEVNSTLQRVVPRTTPVSSENADVMWQNRRKLFFKPVSGFGSRGVFRGAKITKRVWQSIVAGGYIAQEYIAPSLSLANVDGVPQDMKLDIRAYVYDGEIQLLAARRYQGQATNMRTDGGGFASVYSAVS